MNHLFGKKKDAAAATPKTTDAVSNMAEVRATRRCAGSSAGSGVGAS